MTETITQHYLNWVDYVIIGVIVFSVIISFFRGFIREAISLVVWVFALVIALKYSTGLQAHLSSWIASETIRYFISFVGIFLVIIIVGMVVNSMIHRVVANAGLSMADRCLGIFFGAARGVAIVALMLLLITNLGTEKDSYTLYQSKLAIRFKPVVSWLDKYLPDEIKNVSQWVGTKPTANKENLANS